MSDTVTVWESGCYVDGWWGYYSTSRALLTALDLGWAREDRETVLLLAEFDLSSMGPAPAVGSTDWLKAGRLAGDCEALALEEGWSLEEDLPEILADCLEEAEGWLNCQPQTLEGHYWGHHPAGGVGWGCWLGEGLRQCESCGTVEDAGDGPDQSLTGLSACCAPEGRLPWPSVFAEWPSEEEGL